MKKNQIILLAVFVLISALMFFRVNMKKKAPVKDLKEAKTTMFVPYSNVKNSMRDLQLIAYGQISPNTELDISFEVQGKLERGDVQLKPGVSFKMNQLLYKVNEEESFFTLSSRKTQLANLVIAALPDIELDFPSERNKWLHFMDQLSPEKRLPELPGFRSQKERMFITSRNILSEYYAIRSLESRMEKYYYLAPFSGTVLEVFAEPGAVVNPGVRIARIAKTGEMEVKVPISVKNLASFRKEGEASFISSEGEVIGKGKILRVSEVINQRTQSVDVYYSIKAINNALIYNGQFVNVAIDQSARQESYAVPRTAVRDNTVHLLVNEQLMTREITVIGTKPDTLFVIGLNNGDQVVLEHFEPAPEIKTFKGIKR